MSALIQEFRFAMRRLARDWRFAVAFLLTLSLAIGANSSVFAIVYSVLLKPLPVPEAGRLVLLSNQYPRAGVGETRFSSAGDYYDRLEAVTALSHQAMLRQANQVIQADGVATPITGMAVTPSLFPLLGLQPALGRAFTEAEGELGNERKVILSHALWQKLYAGDPNAIDKELRLNDRPYTVTGVMPQGFLFYDSEARYWIPLAFTAEQKRGHHSNNWIHIGRLKSGAARAQVQAQVDALNAANLERFPEFREAIASTGFHTRVDGLQELIVGDVRDTLYLLWGGAAFVLLIGAFNIANLALARVNQRRKEIGTHIALGAGPWPVARQMLAENVLLGSTGGLLGLGIAAMALRSLAAFGLDRFPRAGEVQVDLPVAAYSLAIAVTIGLLVAGLPAAGVFRASLASIMRESTRGGTGSRRSRIWRQGLIVVQIGAAFLLVAGSGLLLASFRQLLHTDPGYKTSGVLTISTSAVRAARQGQPALRGLIDRSLEAVRHVPGVISAGVTDSIPLGGVFNDTVTLPEGYVRKPGESVVSPNLVSVTPGYLETMGIRLTQGRYFTEGDRAGAPTAIIIDESVARRFWPGRDPVGRRMFSISSADLKPRPDERWLNVVGVVRPVRLASLDGQGNSAGTIYFAYDQEPRSRITFAIAAKEPTEGIVKAIREAILQVDPSLALFDIRPMEERVRLSLASRRASLSLALAFGILALLLSTIGIFGVLSYLLSQRRKEIGIRMAVGSTARGIFRMFVGEGLILTAAGLSVGFAGSMALQKVIAGQVYQVHPLDPVVFGASALVLGVAALVACAIPARVAMRTDPVSVLGEP